MQHPEVVAAIITTGALVGLTLHGGRGRFDPAEQIAQLTTSLERLKSIAAVSPHDPVLEAAARRIRDELADLTNELGGAAGAK